MSEDVLLEVNEGVALITLNRPDALNTVNWGILQGLGDAYRRCDEDDTIKVVVVTGAGRAFCAGADLSGGEEAFDTPESEEFSSCPLSFQAWDVRKPVIAACNGHAIGVGLGIALQCDMRVLADEAKYGVLQVRRGVVADFAVEYLLPRMVGFERAFEMIVGGVTLSGTQAREWGVASRSCTSADVLETALDIARDMAVNCSPLVMGLHKRLMWQGQSASLAEMVDVETRALHHTMGAADALEGGMAWFEKRDPQWQSSVTKNWPEWMSQPNVMEK
jgi:enoyl-CoA hydratase/carnithine racemase